MPSHSKSDEPVNLPMVLGSLRSELDTPDEVPPNFDRLRRAFYAALDSYLRGERTKSDIAPLLDGLKATDATGQQWTLGATTGTWFRRVGSRWMMSGPPVAVSGDAQDGPWREIAARLLSENLNAPPSAPPPATADPAPQPAPIETTPDIPQDPPMPTVDPVQDRPSPLGASAPPAPAPATDEDLFAAFLPSPSPPPPAPLPSASPGESAPNPAAGMEDHGSPGAPPIDTPPSPTPDPGPPEEDPYGVG